MNYTERQLAEFRELFASLQRRRKQSNLLGIAAWVTIAIGMLLKVKFGLPTEALIWLPGSVFAGSVIYSMFMLKCPGCGTRLAQEKVKFCQSCGLPLAD